MTRPPRLAADSKSASALFFASEAGMSWMSMYFEIWAARRPEKGMYCTKQTARSPMSESLRLSPSRRMSILGPWSISAST